MNFFMKTWYVKIRVSNDSDKKVSLLTETLYIYITEQTKFVQKAFKPFPMIESMESKQSMTEVIM